jgi:molybdopterin molybdotransferase
MNEHAASHPLSAADACAPNAASLWSVEQAQQHMLELTRPIEGTENVSLTDALGRVLAQSLHSPVDVPAMDCSAMDGYALRAADLYGNGATAMSVSQRIAAGDLPQPLLPRTAARIFTGAPLPSGADAVVMQETVETTGDAIRLQGTVEPGQFVRRRGEDVSRHHLVLPPGIRLTAAHIGLAASVGVAALPVMRRLRVALVATGSELETPGRDLPPGKIYNTNLYFLGALLRQMNCDISSSITIGDDPTATEKALAEAAAAADIVITSGGVSVGDEDHVKAAVDRLGNLSLWRVAMKPGKPVAFGRIGSALFLGLPGNPVSAFITYCLFAQPILQKLSGTERRVPQAQRLPAAFSWRNVGPRRNYLRARCARGESGDQEIHIWPNQNSGALAGVAWAQGLAVIQEGTSVEAGQLVPYISFAELGLSAG